MIELLGYFGAVLLTLSAVPQLIKTIRSKRSNDLSISMLLSWSIGCFSMFIYVLATSGSYPLLFNYLFNTLVSFAIVVAYFKYKT